MIKIIDVRKEKVVGIDVKDIPRSVPFVFIDEDADGKEVPRIYVRPDLNDYQFEIVIQNARSYPSDNREVISCLSEGGKLYTTYSSHKAQPINVEIKIVS
jgi:hypothetical protein